MHPALPDEGIMRMPGMSNTNGSEHWISWLVYLLFDSLHSDGLQLHTMIAAAGVVPRDIAEWRVQNVAGD